MNDSIRFSFFFLFHCRGEIYQIIFISLDSDHFSAPAFTSLQNAYTYTPYAVSFLITCAPGFCLLLFFFLPWLVIILFECESRLRLEQFTRARPCVCVACSQEEKMPTHSHTDTDGFLHPPPPGRDSVVTPPISGSRKKKREQEKRAGATCRARQRGSAGHPLHPSVAICIKVTFHCNREKKKKKLRERILHMFFDLPKKSQN